MMHEFHEKSANRLRQLLDTLSSHPAPIDRMASYAMAKAVALATSGDLVAARSLMEYARRIAPSDAIIGLATGLLRLALGDPLAAEPLEMLTLRTEWQAPWIALVMVRMRFGNTAGAAADLQALLSRMAVSRSESDIEVATTVTRLADGEGWCGLDNGGRVTFAIGRKSLRGLGFLLDGTEISCSEPRQSKEVHDLRLPRNWQKAAQLEVLLRGRALIGSPIDVARVSRVEGFVKEASTGALQGWCRFPAERERVPIITVTSLDDPRKRRLIRAESTNNRVIGGDEFAIVHNFAIAADKIESLGNAVRVSGPHGRVLYGSPIQAGASEASARATMLAVAQQFPLSGESRNTHATILPPLIAIPVTPTTHAGPKARQLQPGPVDIVIPVYRGGDAVLSCIASIRSHLDTNERIIVIVDGSPERELVAALSALADRADILLHLEATNRAYPAAANIGLRMTAGHDVILLNADTIVTPGWLTRLQAAAHSAPDIGTATPLSNDATIFSYPLRDGPNPCPDEASAARLAILAAAANQGATIDVPTGHGFCLYIRAECLQETGVLREDLFAQGYGEANDFCMRARHLGWRHVAVPGAYVAHRGAGSFDAARDDLMGRNLAILNRLHIGYNEMIARWHREDPLAEGRRRIDLARLQSSILGRDTVLLVTHNRDGGSRRHVTERLAAIAATDRRALLLLPEPAAAAGGEPSTYVACVDVGFQNEFPNLRFRLPADRSHLKSCLEACNVGEIEVHSLIGHDDTVIDLILGLRLPLHLVIHDYSWFCARISLTAGDYRYCGEPPIAACRDCIADNGTNFDAPVSPDELVNRTHRLIRAARSIIAPSDDSARRIKRRFGRDVVVGCWEQPRRFALRDISKTAGQSRPVRICIVGAIGYEKGYVNLLQCARMVARADMPIAFVVVGYTCDDGRLLDTGAVQITGRFDQSEAVGLIRAQSADFAWLPTVAPETWCYALTQIWEAGLYVVVHDIGAQADRVRTSGGGLVVPLQIPLHRLLTLFRTPALIRPERSLAVSPHAK
jgi:GT2 family glycosyltransferase/glycosyltransferase involved in cell wall biosynthesis